MYKLIFILFFITSLQANNCKYIYNIAKNFTKYPSTITAIAYVETKCGRTKLIGDDGNSIGIMQLQITTIRWFAKKEPSIQWLLKLNDKQLKQTLLYNDILNIYIAIKLWERHRKNYGYIKAISRYNGGFHNYKYINKVQKAKCYLHKFFH